MKLLDRYVYGIFFRYYLGGLVLMVTLFSLIVFFEVVTDFVRSGAPLRAMGFYFIYRLPEAAYYMTPMAVLAAAILSLSIMTRQKETMILMSCGMSAYRITRPIVVAALIIAAGMMAMGEYILPAAWSNAEDIWRHEVKKYRDVTAVKQDKVWIKSTSGEIWNIGFVDLAHGILRNVLVIEFQPDKSAFAAIIQARTGKRAPGGGWLFSDVRERRISPEGEAVDSLFESRSYSFALGAGELEHAEKKPEEMNFSEIRAYIAHLKRSGYEDIRYTVDMYTKVSFPLVSVVMALLAIPFGLKSRRGGGALAGVALAVTLGFAFWFLFTMAVSMGHSGKLPPLLAAGGAHLLFTFAASYLLLSGFHMREGIFR